MIGMLGRGMSFEGDAQNCKLTRLPAVSVEQTLIQYTPLPCHRKRAVMKRHAKTTTDGAHLHRPFQQGTPYRRCLLVPLGSDRRLHYPTDPPSRAIHVVSANRGAMEIHHSHAVHARNEAETMSAHTFRTFGGVDQESEDQLWKCKALNMKIPTEWIPGKELCDVRILLTVAYQQTSMG